MSAQQIAAEDQAWLARAAAAERSLAEFMARHQAWLERVAADRAALAADTATVEWEVPVPPAEQ